MKSKPKKTKKIKVEKALGENLVVKEKDSNQRLDAFLVKRYPKHSRTFLQKLIKNGDILVNGGKVKTGYTIYADDKISVNVPAPVDNEVIGEDIPLDIVFEDKDLLVINKAAGMVVHPAVGNYHGTLVNALMGNKSKLSSIGGVIRPGIVHRLDKDTSGLLVIAKNDAAHQSLSKQIKDHTAIRKYLALVKGKIVREQATIHTAYGRNMRYRQKMAAYELEPKDTGIINKFRPDEASLKEAITLYKVKERYNGYTLVECELKTGRTHQIRVHMQYLGFPVVGDTVYGPKHNELGAMRQMLHAYSLSFDHPKTGKRLEFSASLPKDFKEVISKLKK